ncbi:MAG: hypothetical protein JW884_11985 [Deltaproteobacteria bacterium]|nr:hypothetical protein [Deltaproteobacteria bacterium]
MLYLKMPEAKSVLFACSLDRFTPRKAALRDSFWEVDVPAGRSFSYFYIVDGEIYTPPCSQKERDDFGSLNCLYTGQ